MGENWVRYDKYKRLDKIMQSYRSFLLTNMSQLCLYVVMSLYNSYQWSIHYVAADTGKSHIFQNVKFIAPLTEKK